MRLLLDAHISAKRVAGLLERLGHDVVSVDANAELEGAPDEQLFAMAAEQDRIFVTFDAGDVARIAGQWAHEGRSHSGCIILVSLDHSKFRLIIRLLQEEFLARPGPGAWASYTCFLSPSRLK